MLNEPLNTQYFNWRKAAITGDLGESYLRKQTVTEAIAEGMKPTLELAMYAELLALLVAIPGGILAAKHKGKIWDASISVFALFGLSAPCFIYGLLLILFFGVGLQWLPVSGFRTMGDGVGEHCIYLVLPTISMALTQAPLFTRITRSSMLVGWSSD